MSDAALLGAVPALGAVVGFAVFQTVQRRALHRVDVYGATVLVLAVAAAVLVGIALPSGGLGVVRRAPIASVLWCAAAGLVHFALGWTLLAASQVRLGAARTGVIVGAVPLFGALVALAVLDEPLGPVGVVGLVAVVAGVAVIGARHGAGVTPRDAGWGVVAGLGTALCWSVSPVLIRYGLRGVGSPLVGAAIGMLASVLVYGALVVATRGVRATVAPARASGRLLGVSGSAVGLAIWMQWVALDRAPVAVVLAVLQLTPPLVVALAVRVSGDALDPTSRRRTWAGATLTLAGSMALVLAG